MRTLALLSLIALGCGAPPPATDSTDDGIQLVRPRVLQPSLTIDRITPDLPNERAPMAITFRISGGTGIRNGWVAATILPPDGTPYDDGDPFPITNLATTDTIAGVVALPRAPRAWSGGAVRVFYYERTELAGEFYRAVHLSESDPTPLDIRTTIVSEVTLERIDSSRTVALPDDLVLDVATSFGERSQHLGAYASGTIQLHIQPDRFDLIPGVSPDYWLHFTLTNDHTNLNRLCNGVVAEDFLHLTSTELDAATSAHNGVWHTERYRLPSPVGCNTGDYTVTRALLRSPSIVGLKPVVARVRPGGSVRFSPTGLYGAITYRVDGGAVNGTIDPSGLFTATQPLARDRLVVVTASDGKESATAYVAAAP